MSYYLPHQNHSAKLLNNPPLSHRTLSKLTDQRGQGSYFINICKQNQKYPKYTKYQSQHLVAQNSLNHRNQLQHKKLNKLKNGKHDNHSSTPYSDQHSKKIYNYLELDFKKPKQLKDQMSTSMQYQSSRKNRSRQQCNQQSRQLQFFDDPKKEKQRKGSFCMNKKQPSISQLTADSKINQISNMKRSHMVEKSQPERIGYERKNQNQQYKKKVQNWKNQDLTIAPPPSETVRKIIKSVKVYNKASRKMDQFLILKKLGEGSFGQVFLVIESHTNAIFALKAISKNYLKSKENSFTTIFRQIKIQLYLDHPNIVKLYHVFADFDYIYLVMEVMDSNLYDYVQVKKHLCQNQVADDVYSLMKAVNCLHKQKIIHRDLKLQNIMLCNKVIKLGDFGCAIHTLNLRNTKIGSLAYHSPQQLKQNFYNQKVDVWGIGIITYQLFFGQTPYDSDIIKILQSGAQTHQLSELVFPQNIKIPPQARDFILKMLEKDHKKRMNLTQAMNHNFIKIYADKQEFL